MKPMGKACPDYLAKTGVVPMDVEKEPWRMGSGEANWHFAESGCLVKFPSTGGKLWWEAEPKMEQPPEIDAPDNYWRIREFKVAPVRMTGAAWSRFGISPQLQGSGGVFGVPGFHCVCRSSRLDVDGYGRVFAPDSLAFCVRVFDAAGNELASIGSYGNPDSRDIGNAGVRFLAASDERLYLSDEGNSRIVRVKLSHRVEEEMQIP
jgi:hypothetical protein